MNRNSAAKGEYNGNCQVHGFKAHGKSILPPNHNFDKKELTTMKLAMYENQVYLIKEEGEKITGISLSNASGGRFGGDMMSLLNNWANFSQWSCSAAINDYPITIERTKLQAPINTSRQIFAIGLNYKSHIAEIKMEIGKPDIFTKFISSIADPYANVKLSSHMVDWEVELVAVIGKGGRNICRENALEHVAGYMIGQDISDRQMQFAGSARQFSLGKSYEGYAPIGPWITTMDEVQTPLDLALSSAVNGEIMQDSRTGLTLNNVDTLIEELSSVTELYPGDLIFTGTPGGVGFGRDPYVFLQKGDMLESRVEGLGFIKQKFV